MILKRATAGFNRVDAAVAKPINKKVIKSDIPEIGKIQGAAEANLRDKIKKLGRTSGLTTGMVDGLDVTIEVAMADGISSVFENQIVSDLKSLPGDSGSLVLNSDNEAVGLLFAGSSSRTVINPINSVLEELDIELV
jgi:di/tripeptidase